MKGGAAFHPTQDRALLASYKHGLIGIAPFFHARWHAMC